VQLPEKHDHIEKLGRCGYQGSAPSKHEERKGAAESVKWNIERVDITRKEHVYEKQNESPPCNKLSSNRTDSPEFC
jgi:hypothetical protein